MQIKAKSKKFNLKKVNWALVSMLIPGIILLIVFKYIPIAGVIVAFKRLSYVDTIWSAPWCGLDNFKFLFTTPDAWVITRNTVLYNIVFIVGGLFLNVLFAIMLDELRNKHAVKIYQNIIFLPFLFSIVIVTYLYYGFFSQNYGILNSILKMLGRTGINWYNDVSKWPFILVFVNFWMSIGYGSILYIAGIAGIDESLFDAAKIDGASRWQKIRYVTIPSLMPIIIINFIMGVGRIFNSDFGLFYTFPMNSASLYRVTNVIDTYVYRSLMITGDTGMSAAAALYQSAVGFVLVMIANGIVNKIDSDKAMF